MEACGWEGLPTPLADLGEEQVERLSAMLVDAARLAEKGAMDFHQELHDMVLHFVSERFGEEGAARINRVAPLIWHFGMEGAVRETAVPGLGRRLLTRPVEGLRPEQPFHDVADHAWCQALASSVNIIRNELSEYRGADQWGGATEGSWGCMEAPGWQALGLVQGGAWVAGDDCFPQTRAILRSLKAFRPEEVFFARMPPGGSIGEHSDKLNFLLVAHLGLEVEEGRCTLRVGACERQWREGEVFVFDHSYVHSATNKSSRDRYVLACRFWHPSLSEVERYALQLLQLLTSTMQRIGREVEE